MWVSTPNPSQMEEIKAILTEIRQLTLISSKDILTLEESAVYLGISEKTLRSHIGEFRRYKPSGKQVYIRKEELDRWMMRNPIPSDEDVERQAGIYIDNHQF